MCKIDYSEYEVITIETDEKDPVVIAEFTETEIHCNDGYRIRMKPKD